MARANTRTFQRALWVLRSWTIPVILCGLTTVATNAQVPANSCGALGAGNQYPVATTCTPVAMNTNGFSPSFNPGGCLAGNNDDAWASFVATTSQTTVQYTITGCSGFLCGFFVGSVMHVFSGTCGSLTSLGCNTGGFGTGSTATVTATTTPGNTYYVRVQRLFSNANMAGTLCITAVPDPPVNDACASATVVADGNHPFTTLGATGSMTTSCSVGDVNDVWFAHTVSCTGELTVSTCGMADFDTALSLFDACSGNELACSEDVSGCANFTSRITIDAFQGQQILVRIAGFQGATGSGSVSISCSEVTWYSQGSGNMTDPIWDRVPVGTPGPAVFDPYSSVTVQSGHDVVMDQPVVEMFRFEVENNASFDASASIVMYVGGDWTMHGTFDPGQRYVQFRGPGQQSINGSATTDFYDVEVDNISGMVVNADSVHIFGSLYLTNGNMDANGKQVVLRSDATATARLGQVPASASYSGALRMERFIPAGATNWRMLSSAVGSATLQQWKQDFFTAGFPGSHYPPFDNPVGSGILWPSIRSYDETDPGPAFNDGLHGPTDITDLIHTGKGYIAWSGDNLNTTSAFVVDVSGPPNIATTPIALPMTYTNTGSPPVDGWNLVGNPLPSPIDFSDLNLGADVDNAFWVYDPASGNTIFWNEDLGTGSSVMNGNIQSSQGFWLHATGPNATATVDESAKTADPNGGAPFGGMMLQPEPMVRLSIHSEHQTFSDETLLHFGAGTPVNEDLDMHKLKFSHIDAPHIWSVSDEGVDLALNAWGPVDDFVEIPLAVEVGVSGMYALEVTQFTQALEGHCLVLVDALAGVETPLELGSTWSVQLNAGTPALPARFLVRVSNLSTAQLLVSNNTVNFGDTVFFGTDAPLSTPVHWDLGDGSTSMAHHFGHVHPMPGTYAVSLELGSGTCTEHRGTLVMVDQATGVVEQLESFFHAWADDGAINVSWNEISGPLELSILDPLGREVIRERHTATEGRTQVPLPNKATGVHVVRLSNGEQAHVLRLLVL